MPLRARNRSAAPRRWTVGFALAIPFGLTACQPPPAASIPLPVATVAPPVTPLPTVAQARTYALLVQTSDVINLFQDELAAYVARPALAGGVTLAATSARIRTTSGIGRNASGEIGIGIEVLGAEVKVSAEKKYAIISEMETEVRFALPSPEVAARVRGARTNLGIDKVAHTILYDLLNAQRSAKAPLSPYCAKVSFHFELTASSGANGEIALIAHGGISGDELRRQGSQIEIAFQLRKPGTAPANCDG